MIKYPAKGLYGGGNGINGAVILDGKRIYDFKPIDWQPQHELVLIVPSGGGYGNPKNRNNDQLLNDIINENDDIEHINQYYKKSFKKNDVEVIKKQKIKDLLNNETGL